MLSGLLVRYVLPSVLGLALMGGGLLYVKHLKASRDAWQKVALEQKRVIEIYEKDKKTDKETEDKKHEVSEASNPDDLTKYYDELRRKARGAEGGKSGKAND